MKYSNDSRGHKRERDRITVYGFPNKHVSHRTTGRPLTRPFIGHPNLMLWLAPDLGTNWVDYSGRGHNAVPTGPVRKDTGRFGPAWWFDNTDDYHTIPTHADLLLADTFTIEAWIKQRSIASGFQSILTKWAAAGDRGYAFQTNNQTINLYYTYDGTNLDNTITAGILDTNWNYIVVTGVAGGNCNIYLNGVLKKTDTITASIFQAVTDVTVGTLLGGEPFDGIIDEIKLWNIVLDLPTIKQLYIQGKPHEEA